MVVELLIMFQICIHFGLTSQPLSQHFSLPSALASICPSLLHPSPSHLVLPVTYQPPSHSSLLFLHAGFLPSTISILVQDLNPKLFTTPLLLNMLLGRLSSSSSIFHCSRFHHLQSLLSLDPEMMFSQIGMPCNSGQSQSQNKGQPPRTEIGRNYSGQYISGSIPKKTVVA